MRFIGWTTRLGAVLAVGTLGTVLLPTAASATVSLTPAAGTPQLATTGTTETVRQIVQCGGTMYAVGSFTEIKWKGTVYSRDNVFSFSATAPYTVSSWDPNANGVVNSIALSPDCSTAYLGGKFSSIAGTPVKNIAAVSTSTGAVISSFGHSANGQVETVLDTNGHLITGGMFTSINGSSADAYMASLDPTTGQNDGFISLDISGNYSYCLNGKCTASNPTHVYNQQLSPSGSQELVEGDFTSVGGQARQQMFMLDLTGSTATVTGWSPPILNDNCWFSEPFYVKDAAWSPDSSTVYIGTTGYHLDSWNGRFPLTGPCDAALSFPATGNSVSPNWINYTGCDSLFASAADSTTAYFGGHERWSQNPDGCDSPGNGAISAPGMEGLSPSTGLLTYNPTRGRGHGADDMLMTSAGLWIASDNFNNTAMCGKQYGHAGICFFPN